MLEKHIFGNWMTNSEPYSKEPLTWSVAPSKKKKDESTFETTYTLAQNV